MRVEPFDVDVEGRAWSHVWSRGSPEISRGVTEEAAEAALAECAASNAARTFSGVSGSDRRRMPQASNNALAMAGAGPLMGTSPTDLAPYGPLGSGCSTSIVVIAGMSRVVAIL